MRNKQIKSLPLWFVLFLTFPLNAQEKDITGELYETYERYKEPSLDKRRVKYHEIQPFITEYRKNPKFTVKTVGTSIAGRDLNLISIGKGETSVFLWSQMHGNEPTATLAIFDILKFLDSEDFKAEKKKILDNLTLHFLPMLNPDGAEVYQRRNLLGIDINRDALRLQSPESRTLKRVRDSLEAHFGFNLHDQSIYYNAERTDKPATISYLAPPYNYEKEINETRGNAMKVIAFMNGVIQKYAPGQVGRYSDDFEPRAFGDNIQKWGTSAILIESGGYPNDVEKQEIRKLNYVSLLSAIYTIATGSYRNIALSEYEKIPQNDRKLFDLKIEKASYQLLGNDYVLDIGINQLEVDKVGNNDFWYSSRVLDLGDLSTYYGYETLDASGYKLKPGKVYPEILDNIAQLEALEMGQVLKKGYTYIRIKNIDLEQLESPFPIHIVSERFEIPEFHLELGSNPTFLLETDSGPRYAIVNGFPIDLAKSEDEVMSDFKGKNAMIYR